MRKECDYIMRSLTPNLMVNSVNDTIQYYREILGFELTMTVPKAGKYNWALMKCGNVEIMFQERINLINEYPVLGDRTSGSGLTIYIRVVDVEALYNEIKEKVKLVSDLHKTFYHTTEFAIMDINGFVITFSN